MKKIINIILFIIYFFSFVSHNTIMAFTDMSNHHNISNNLTNLTHNDNHQKQPVCSIIVDNNQNIQWKTENTFLKSPEIKQPISFDFYTPDFSINYFTQNIDIPSPPFFNKDIKNYNYTTLIKIIKSNT